MAEEPVLEEDFEVVERPSQQPPPPSPRVEPQANVPLAEPLPQQPPAVVIVPPAEVPQPAPAVVVPQPIPDLARAMQVVNARDAADIAGFQTRVGADLSTMATAIVPAATQLAAAKELKDNVITDPNALKLTRGQKAAYGFLKFWVYAFGWLGYVFTGGKYHPLDTFEKWKARKAVNLSFVSGAVDRHLATVNANPQRTPNGVTMRIDLLNWLAYVPADGPTGVKATLRTVILGSIPEGTQEFKEQLADLILDQISAKLYASEGDNAPWTKIKAALDGVAAAITTTISEQRQALAAAMTQLEADTTLAAAGDHNIQSTPHAALTAHQATLAALLAEIGRLPDDPAPAPVAEGGEAPAAAPDSKTGLQGRVTTLTDRITAEIARRQAIVDRVAQGLAPLEAEPALAAPAEIQDPLGAVAPTGIQATDQAVLTAHQATLARLQSDIDALPVDSPRGDVPGRLAAVTGRVTAELTRRQAELTAVSNDLRDHYEAEQQLLVANIGVASPALLNEKAAGLADLRRRIGALPVSFRGDVPDRLQAVVERITAEQTRRQEVLGPLDARLQDLEGSLTRENVAVMAIERLDRQHVALAQLRQGIIDQQLPEELSAALKLRLDALIVRVNSEFLGKVTADITRLEGTLGRVDSNRVSGNEAQTYARDLATLRKRLGQLTTALNPDFSDRIIALARKVEEIRRVNITARVPRI